MALAAGQHLVHYEILEPIGRGGMGEVWRARDTRLERDVAIKVLPAALAGDPDRLRRFEREAKLLAALNHPNVGGIHGVDEARGTTFLALELVPGEDLAERIARGPLPMAEALDVCRQVAEGLEAAHEAGVVHRDLKPANVRVTPDGVVKVLDFGLAKASRADDPDSAVRTLEGTVLGTPTYMAPEQARGRSVDRRVDVWALGCVLYECLTGTRAFGGDDLGEVLHRVLEGEPDLDALPPRTPARVRELLERCLRKDPRARLRDAGDARLELEAALAERAWTSGRDDGGAGRGSVWPWAVAVVAGGLALVGWLWPRAEVPAAQRTLRLSIDLDLPFARVYPRLAPDGSAVVHEGIVDGRESDVPVRALYLRPLDAFAGRLIPGTENPRSFCFSPDASELAVLVERSGRSGQLTLVRVPLAGDGPSVAVGPWPRQYERNGSIVWLEGDLVVGSADPGALIRFPLDQAQAELVPLDRAFERSGSGVELFRRLGDGRHALGHTFHYDERGYSCAVVAVDVARAREKIVAMDGGFGALAPDGRLMFTRREALYAAPFDADAFTLTGSPTVVASGLRTESTWRPAWFDVAADGTTVWLPGGRKGGGQTLAIFERDGTVSPLWDVPMAHDGTLTASSNGTYLTSVVVSDDGQRVEIWGTPIDRPALRRIVAEAGVDYMSGVPLAGGRELIYRRISNAAGDGIFRLTLDAAAEPELLVPADPNGPDSWPVTVAPTGEFLVVAAGRGEGVEFSTISLTGPDTEPMPLLRTETDLFWPKLSDDGKWVAVVADELDRSEVVVRAMRGRETVGTDRVVPLPEGEMPWDFVWSRDPASGLLDFLMVTDDRRSVWAVPLEDEATGRFGEPRLLGRVEGALVVETAPLADGRMAMILEDPDESGVDRIEVTVGGL